MKRRIILCLALLLGVCLLGGCTAPSEDQPTEAPSAAEPATGAPATDVPATDAPTAAPTAAPTDAPTETVKETDPDLVPPAYTLLDFCHYNYECVRSVNEVVADGVYNESEWAEANELIINNTTLEDWGRWQAGPALDAADLSVTFKLKWDEDYLYLLEIRTDSHYVYEFGDKGYNVFSDVWGGDATAFFLCDGYDDSRENRCDIGYFTYVDKLEGPAVYVGSFDGEPDAFRGPSGTEGCTYGGTYDGERAVFEMKLPWAIMENQGKLFSVIEEGALFRFNPIIPSVDTTDGLGMYNSEWRQINFHDCVDNGENGNPDDPYYWAAMTLVVDKD